MTVGVLVACVILAVAAGAAVGTFASHQLSPAEEEKASLGQRARRAATRGMWRWVSRRKTPED